MIVVIDLEPMGETTMENKKLTAEEYAALVQTVCLTPAGLADAKKHLAITAKDSEFLPDRERELAEAQARWDREAPVRAAREALNKAGWFKSDYRQGEWYHKKTRAKASLIQAIRLAGLAE